MFIFCHLSCQFSIVKYNAFFGVKILAWNPVCVQKITFCKSVFGGNFRIIDCVSNISVTICVTFGATNKMIHLVRNIWHADEPYFSPRKGYGELVSQLCSENLWRNPIYFKPMNTVEFSIFMLLTRYYSVDQQKYAQNATVRMFNNICAACRLLDI